jgi:hypothetical protein
MFRNNPLVQTVVGLLVLTSGSFVLGTALYTAGLPGTADVVIWTTIASFLLAVLLAVIVTPFLIGSWILHRF